MKRVLSIIIGLILVGCLTGCQSTKVETPVVEAPVEERVHPESIQVYINLNTPDVKVIEIPLNGKYEYDYDYTRGGGVAWVGDTAAGWGSFGNASKIVIEYFPFKDDEVLKISAYMNHPLDHMFKWYDEHRYNLCNGVQTCDNEKMNFYFFLRPFEDMYHYQLKDEYKVELYESLNLN